MKKNNVGRWAALLALGGSAMTPVGTMSALAHGAIRTHGATRTCGTTEHYPETRTRTLSADEVADWSAAQRRYTINEMYARHGFVFQDMAIRKQFLQFSWYHPVPGRTQRQVENLFNGNERRNLSVLTASRPQKSHGGAHEVPMKGERYPQTRTRYMDRDDIAAWNEAQMRYAINEMYARHGLTFKDVAIRKQFLQFDWYKPVPGRTQRQAEARFNEFERANLKLLSEMR